MMRAATVAFLLVSSVAQASPATDLGDAIRAYEAGDLAQARKSLAGVTPEAIENDDYLYWVRGMIELRDGKPAEAKQAFAALGKQSGSRFAKEVPWRLADCEWEAGNRKAAAKLYGTLVAADSAGDHGDVGTARFRIAQATGSAAAYRAFALSHPGHPLAARAIEELHKLGAPDFTATERIERAKALTVAHLWDDAVAELSLLGGKQTKELARQRDYWLATTLFKMRRRYGEAGKLYLSVYKDMGGNAAEAMFHGARALSRADQDGEAIRWYEKVVATYPSSDFAPEAAYLAGWLEFNRNNYQAAIAPLEASLAKYPKSKWVDDALWFLGLSHYFLGEWKSARTRWEALEKRGGSLEGGKGAYWLSRLDEKLDQGDAAIERYRKLVARYPFSWYACLARARLAARGVQVGPFGVDQPTPKGAKLAEKVDERLASDDLIERADELIAAGLITDAGEELRRGEKPFLARHDRGAAFAMLLDRYRKAGNFNRPWMLAVSHHGGALNGPPEGDARRWWEHAYPRAYRELVEQHEHLGANPEGYLYSIMRKESGFNPHDLSYADAQGLLQMIPATTRRVAKELALPYDAGRLYEPEFNVMTGSWYIGKMLQKFKGQVPIGAGSFNSGPRPVMKWLDQWGDREIDEFVELVPYTQTREYMKKVTENVARYQYLYQNVVYDQPLTIDKAYQVNRLTY